MLRRASIVAVLIGAAPDRAGAGVVVGHDINTLGSAIATAQEATFAVNVANFLTAGRATKNLLLFESNPGDGSRNFATIIRNALLSAEFSVTVTASYATPYATYDAIFIAEDYPSIGFVDNNALINYANGGGGIYLAGGVGNTASVEAAGWSTFMNHFGLAFATSYNTINNVPITSAHAIFSGVTALRSGNGQSISALGTNPNAEIVQSSGSQGMYAVVHTPSLGDADFDLDGDVDGADFMTWQRGLGISENAVRQDGDADGDGVVDAGDLAIWQNQFGSAQPIFRAPEPDMWVMVVLSASAALRGRRRLTTQTEHLSGGHH